MISPLHANINFKKNMFSETKIIDDKDDIILYFCKPFMSGFTDDCSIEYLLLYSINMLFLFEVYEENMTSHGNALEMVGGVEVGLFCNLLRELSIFFFNILKLDKWEFLKV